MNITVIGANSYIARNFIDLLKKQKVCDELFLYDYQEKQFDNLENYTQIDVLDKESWQQVKLDVDTIFYFTGKTGTQQGFYEPKTFIDINEISLLNLLNEYVSQKSLGKIIFPSTRLVYKGKDGCLYENDEKEFKTIYGINKYACEKYLEMYGNVYGVKYCILRICVPYGTFADDARSYGTIDFMLSKVMKGENIQLYGDGELKRTYTHICDLCDVMIKVMQQNVCNNDVYNVGGEVFSLKEVATRIADRYGVDVEYVDWPQISKKIETGSTYFNSDKLDKEIGNSYKHSLIQWIDEHS